MATSDWDFFPYEIFVCRLADGRFIGATSPRHPALRRLADEASISAGRWLTRGYVDGRTTCQYETSPQFPGWSEEMLIFVPTEDAGIFEIPRWAQPAAGYWDRYLAWTDGLGGLARVLYV